MWRTGEKTTTDTMYSTDTREQIESIDVSIDRLCKVMMIGSNRTKERVYMYSKKQYNI